MRMKLNVVKISLTLFGLMSSILASANGHFDFTENVNITNTSYGKLKLYADNDDSNCVQIALPGGANLKKGNTAKVKVHFLSKNCDWYDQWNFTENHSAKH